MVGQDFDHVSTLDTGKSLSVDPTHAIAKSCEKQQF